MIFKITFVFIKYLSGNGYRFAGIATIFTDFPPNIISRRVTV